jgi:hypothetical protein
MHDGSSLDRLQKAWRILFRRDLIFSLHEELLAIKNTPWPESANVLYLPSDCRFSEKLLPTFADRGCQVVSMTDPYGLILGFSRPDIYQ